MGSKNLKAIAVKGSGPVTVFDGGRFMNKVDELRERILSTPKAKIQRRLGTPAAVIRKQETYPLKAG